MEDAISLKSFSQKNSLPFVIVASFPFGGISFLLCVPLRSEPRSKRLLHLLERPLAFRRKSKPRFLELKFSRRHLFYYHYGNFLNVDRPPKPPRPSLIFAAAGTDKKEQLSMTQKNWSSEGGGDENVAPTPKKRGEEGAPASCNGHFSSSSTFRSPTSF